MKASGTVLSRGTVYYAIQTGVNPWVRVDSVEEVLTCANSNESYWSVLSHAVVHYALQSGSYFWVYGWSSIVCQLKWKLLIRIFCGGTIYYSVWGRFNRPESAWDPNLVKGQNVSKGSNLISYVNISSLCIRWGFPCQQKTLLTLFCPICAVCVFPTNEVNRQVTDLLNWRLYFKRDRLVRTSTTFCLRFDREIVFVTTREF